MIDPHEIRMAAGENMIATLDALDDDTLALFEPATDALHALGQRLASQGLAVKDVTQILVGVAVAVGFHDHE